ncbi:WhiB family transcriptional regulator [Mycobacteroides abscessus]|uniref:WhiB family transcriptional regulator n=1 Tax=Mycobacteroides abscessus TaxID=36809 RepID=UPI003AF36344
MWGGLSEDERRALKRRNARARARSAVCGPALAQIADAKLVCNRCPVTTECLTWALESGQDAGVWGGLSEDERRALKRRNARARARSAV